MRGLSSVPAWAAALSWPNRIAALGSAFFTELQPAGLPDPRLLAWSADCARSLGWPEDGDPAALSMLAGNALWPGMRPLASVYSGHQFGVWAGQLGDGRAHLLGEVATPGGRAELQLKGAGRTPYSRGADGRAVLRSSLREYVASEAMHHLGVPTTRALALVASPLPVRREQMEPAAVVLRVAPSFIRFGHFEHFAHRGQMAELQALTRFVIDAYYPELAASSEPLLDLLRAVALRTARLMAHWQALGFTHGVMNTDNFSILGLTIDYGPYGFVDAYEPLYVPNHSDERGRYALGRQPAVGLWNVQALAAALAQALPASAHPALHDAVVGYEAEFLRAQRGHLLAKLGLPADTQADDSVDADLQLAADWLRLMASARADHTLAWRHLADALSDAQPTALLALYPSEHHTALTAWLARWRARHAREAGPAAQRQQAMRRSNPRLVPRGHLLQTAITAAEAGDNAPLQRLMAALTRPYDDDPASTDLALPPPAWAQGIMLSCSS